MFNSRTKQWSVQTVVTMYRIGINYANLNTRSYFTDSPKALKKSLDKDAEEYKKKIKHGRRFIFA